MDCQSGPWDERVESDQGVPTSIAVLTPPPLNKYPSPFSTEPTKTRLRVRIPCRSFPSVNQDRYEHVGESHSTKLMGVIQTRATLSVSALRPLGIKSNGDGVAQGVDVRSNGFLGWSFGAVLEGQ